MKNLAAYTPPGTNYPPYISVNECDGHVEITVRSHLRDGQCGGTATICLTVEEYRSLATDMYHSQDELPQ